MKVYYIRNYEGHKPGDNAELPTAEARMLARAGVVIFNKATLKEHIILPMKVYFIKEYLEYKPGDEVEIDSDKAKVLSRAGVIVYDKSTVKIWDHVDPIIETTSLVPDAEVAMMPPAKPKRKPQNKR